MKTQKSLDDMISELESFLKEGYSISLSLRKAGIKQHLHTVLLKEPKYKDMIFKYRQFVKSPTEIYLLKIESYKRGMA